MKHYDVVIIGAGTAGLSARKEVAKVTDNYIVVDGGTLGTTCARVGCMPSKILIQAANDFHRRKKFDALGISGHENLTINHKKTMDHVRKLRDRFVKSVINSMDSWSDKFVNGWATLKDKTTLEINGESIKADKIILATGSRPVLPKPWEPYKEFLVDTDTFFEMSTLPKSMAVFGLGVIGIELGQALHRLGVAVVGITTNKAIGALTDPKIQDYVTGKISEEMNVHYNGAEIIGSKNGLLEIVADGKTYFVEKALISVGRKPNIDKIGIENLNISLDQRGIPKVSSTNMQLAEAPNIFLPGDVNNQRPILHEATDEGNIAGHNAVHKSECFKRRVSIGITFSDPNIAIVGKSYKQLSDEKINFVTGAVSFEGQGRSIVKLKEQGLLHLYADKTSGEILGMELQAPDGEHLAHLIAWAITMKLTVFEALKMPFYHPVIEEGIRTALRNAAKQTEASGTRELFLCSDSPIR